MAAALTRRTTLGALLTAGLAPLPLTHAQDNRPKTARELFAAIKTASEQRWDPNPTDDRIIFGALETPVTGIATCFFSSIEVLRAAKAAGLNYIVPHECSFYERYDDLAESAVRDDDPTLSAKKKFLLDNRMVIQRMHAHAHSMAGDFIGRGLVAQLDWTQHLVEGQRFVCRVPPQSALEIGRHIKQRCGRRTLRMFGDPGQSVSTISISAGMPGENVQIAQMEMPGVEAVLLGEVREPDVLGYAQDLAATHRHRGVDPPGTRDRVIAGGSYPAIGTLVDGVRAGDADVPISGIVVAARASTPVLKKAVEFGANIVIGRSAFYGDHQDRPVARPEPALADKIEWIASNKLVVLRLHDPRTGPAGVAIATALPEAIGLRGGRKRGNLADGLVYATPPLTVLELVRATKSALPTSTVRLVGDPAMRVAGVAFATETNRPNAITPLIARPDVNLLVCGEVHETETTPYVMDSIALGQRKAMVIIGSIAMEEPAARKLAGWLKGLVTPPVSYLPSNEGLIEVA